MMTTETGKNLRRLLLDGLCFAFLACVLLVWIVNPSDLQMLDLKTNASFFFFFFFAGALIGEGLARGLRVQTLGARIFSSSVALDDQPFWKKFSNWQLLVVLAVSLFVAGVKTDFSLAELFNPDGFQGALRLFHGLLSPNTDVLPRAVLNILETLFMAFLATAMALPLAFLLSFACAKNIMRSPLAFAIYLVLRTILNVIRSVEALIWAIIFSVWVGIGPFAGMLALMVHSVMSLAKQGSEIVESISDGPVEGVRSTGASSLQVIWFAIVPQVILPFISFTLYRWDINVRMATVIGLVGGGGIGTMLIQYYGQAMWPEVGCIILVIAIVVWAMDQASAHLREALK